jgi:hypothetical protein
MHSKKSQQNTRRFIHFLSQRDKLVQVHYALGDVDLFIHRPLKIVAIFSGA